MTRQRIICAFMVAASAIACGGPPEAPARGSSAEPGGGGEAPPAFSDEILAELTEVVEQTHEELGVPGTAIGLWVDGVGEFTHAVGVSDLETGEPMSLDHHIRIGSVTKTFTGTMIMQLADEGMLSLDDPVNDYFDGQVPNGDAITITNLLNMTSGLANYTFDPSFQERLFADPSGTFTPEELVRIGWTNTEAGCPHASSYCFEPGEGWAYCNTNTVMLGMIIERVTGKTYAEVLQERIVGPLGLEHTAQGGDTLPEPFARGYTPQGAEEGTLREATSWDPTWAFAVGDIVSTLNDLRIYGEALGSGALLSEEMHARRLTRVTLPPHTAERAYMLGIGVHHGWLGHGGELPGYNTIVYHRPDIGATLVAVMNRDSVFIDGAPRSPVYILLDRIVEIASREAPLGDFDDRIHYDEGLLPD